MMGSFMRWRSHAKKIKLDGSICREKDPSISNQHIGANGLQALRLQNIMPKRRVSLERIHLKQIFELNAEYTSLIEPLPHKSLATQTGKWTGARQKQRVVQAFAAKRANKSFGYAVWPG